jgi:hypothetical protein
MTRMEDFKQASVNGIQEAPTVALNALDAKTLELPLPDDPPVQHQRVSCAGRRRTRGREFAQAALCIRRL